MRRAVVRAASPVCAALVLVACSGDDSAGDTGPSGATTGTAVVDTDGAGESGPTGATTGTAVVDTGESSDVSMSATASSAAPAPTGAVAPTSGSAGTSEPGSSTPSGPFEFTSPEGDYTITFPGTPAENTQPTPLPDGSTLPVTFYLYRTPTRAFGTASIEYPEGTTVDLEGARDGALASVGGTLVESETVVFQGRQGIRFVGDVGEGAGTYLSRVYGDGLKLYQVVVVVQGAAAANDPEIVAFFESFQFTDGG